MSETDHTASAASVRPLTRAEALGLREVINDLTNLAVLYERRLIFKGRYRRQAEMAAAGRRHALTILRRFTDAA